MARGKRIIVFSDTHGRERAMIDILEKEAYAYIFLGDGERELDRMRERYPDKRIYNVRGNCDFASSAPDIDLLSVDGVRIMFTHGHNHGVKYSTDRLFIWQSKTKSALCCSDTPTADTLNMTRVYIL